MFGAVTVGAGFAQKGRISPEAAHGLRIAMTLASLAIGAAAGRDGRKLFLAATIVALALIWGEIWRNGGLTLGELIGDRKGRKIAYWATWVIREAMWWWLVTLLIGCVTSLLATSTAVREAMAAWQGRRRRKA